MPEQEKKQEQQQRGLDAEAEQLEKLEASFDSRLDELDALRDELDALRDELNEKAKDVENRESALEVSVHMQHGICVCIRMWLCAL